MTGAVTGSALEYIVKTMKRRLDMGGVVAGSTMFDIGFAERKWGAIMINTGCNKNCRACYLGPKVDNVAMSKEIVVALVEHGKKNWDGVAIIGTEPLLDDLSVETINAFASAIRTHVMTNGVNLGKFANKLNGVERIDISLDGGPKTYCRSGDFQDIIRGASRWKEATGKEVYALNMLSDENCQEKNVEDMLQAGVLIGAEKTLFSPYIRTIGGSDVVPASLEHIVDVLRHFPGANWFLTVDPYHAILEWKKWQDVKNNLVSALSPENLLIIDFDPGDMIVRVDINGRAHHPLIALHPGIKLPGAKLF
jgi:sulfatase maturation enzyme AslB (radical SAM superfamily)